MKVGFAPVLTQVLAQKRDPQTISHGDDLRKSEDDYKVIFGGATISKKEAKRVSVALLFGIVAIGTLGFVFGLRKKGAVFILSFIFAVFGYFVVARQKIESNIKTTG